MHIYIEVGVLQGSHVAEFHEISKAGTSVGVFIKPCKQISMCVYVGYG